MKHALASALLLAGCAAPSASRPIEPAQRAPWSAPPLEGCVAVLTTDGERLTLDELYDRLAAADVVFLGETHLDETTHRLELGVYEAMLARRGEVVLALEMFERDVQGTLDAYLSGDIDEPAFLASARPWSNYRTAYRPLVERAKAAGQPVVASNFPRPLLREVAQAGLGAVDALEGDARRQAPAEILPNTREYRLRTDNAVRGHLGMMGGPVDPDEPRLTSTQTLWDNAMGDACARALREHPGAQVVHVNGSFHSAYWDGTARQCRLRAPEARIVTVAIVPSSAAASSTFDEREVADYVVFTQRGAQDVNDGKHAVWVQKKLEYELHLPARASDAERVPLLLWLSDDGLTTADGLSLWKSRLGDECAIAVLEPPYRERQLDFSDGGRWYWVDRFDDDVSTAMALIEESYGFLLRRYPLDPARVCLAGEGTGATLAAATTLLTGSMDVAGVAIAPREFAKIKDFPLPLPEYAGEPRRKSLRLVVEAGDEAWWQSELAEYARIGLANERVVATDDPWSVEAQREDAVRGALALPAAPPATGAEQHVVAPSDSPRARHWSRLRALAADPRRTAVLREPVERSRELDLEVDRAALATGKGLPRCPGAFGGTTVLVVPDAELADWIALEEQDPLQAESRFQRLRIATAGGERALPDVLARLEGEGRRNVLVVPATFCASDGAMRELVTSVEHLAGRMTLHWLPGLGGTE